MKKNIEYPFYNRDTDCAELFDVVCELSDGPTCAIRDTQPEGYTNFDILSAVDKQGNDRLIDLTEIDEDNIFLVAKMED